MTLLFENTKKYAKLRGLSLQEVALRAGLSINAIYKWNKTDYTPSKPSILATAKVLDVTYADLTGEADEIEPRQIDLKAASDDPDTIMSWNGRPIPPEEMEMIRRILDGGK
ncbi:helix-turn-helix domain-containing protein [Lacticaseibacillus sp. GG6-2]